MTAWFDFAAVQPHGANLNRYRVTRFILSPHHWRAWNATTPMTWSGGVQLAAANAAHVPDNEHGVYSIVVQPGIASHPSCSYLMYIGMVKDQDFRARFKQYLAESKKRKPRPLIKDLMDTWPEHLWFYYASIATVADIPKIEDALIASYVPPYNEEIPAEVGAAVKVARK